MFSQRSRILLTCPKGLATYLEKEIRLLGFPVLDAETAGVWTEGTISDTMTLNLWLRTAHRVLYLIGDTRARSAGELYLRAGEIPWELFIKKNGYFSVSAVVDNPTINDSRYASLKLKDAVVDRFRRIFGSRPDSGSQGDHSVIFMYWKGSRLSIYLDTSGDPLSKRGYRRLPMRAPMQETLASAVILESDWQGVTPLLNPMCGSGTLSIEAALIALGRAPGLTRDNFGFMHIPEFERTEWSSIRNDALARARTSLPVRIVASDIDPKAVASSVKNAKMAGVDKCIDFLVCDYRDTPVPKEKGTVVLNPEYGERLGNTERLKDTYRGIGDFFKGRCSGYRGFVFTGNLDLAKCVGLRTSRRTPFFNGSIECRLLEYKLYKGSLKDRRNANFS